jgi:sulfur relay (sulfurtransferase) DsrC/TusE family protein
MKVKTKTRAGTLAETEGVSDMTEEHWKLVNYLR